MGVLVPGIVITAARAPIYLVTTRPTAASKLQNRKIEHLGKSRPMPSIGAAVSEDRLRNAATLILTPPMEYSLLHNSMSFDLVGYDPPQLLYLVAGSQLPVANMVRRFDPLKPPGWVAVFQFQTAKKASIQDGKPTIISPRRLCGQRNCT